MQAFVPVNSFSLLRAAPVSGRLSARPSRPAACRFQLRASAGGTNDYLNSISNTAPPSSSASSSASAASSPPPVYEASVGGTGGTGSRDGKEGPGSGGGGGGDGADADAGGDEDALAAMLATAKMGLSDIPADILGAYMQGLVTVEVLMNYLHARANWLSRFLMGTSPGMRNRFLADRLFLLKIMIEEGMGIAGKLGAEYERRRENFFKEGEFVFANLVTALLADFALVYLPAPSVSLVKAGGNAGWLQRIATDLPSNIFQTDRPFTLAQRAGGFVLKGSQLFAVGFACCLIGSALTNTLVFAREKIDKNYKPKTVKTNVLAVSALYATFLGISSGSRYQLVNGIENHIFPRLFSKAPLLLEQISTFALRYGNTFWGSQQWIIFCRMTNVQKVAAEQV